MNYYDKVIQYYLSGCKKASANIDNSDSEIAGVELFILTVTGQQAPLFLEAALQWERMTCNQHNVTESMQCLASYGNGNTFSLPKKLLMHKLK